MSHTSWSLTPHSHTCTILKALSPPCRKQRVVNDLNPCVLLEICESHIFIQITVSQECTRHTHPHRRHRPLLDTNVEKVLSRHLLMLSLCPSTIFQLSWMMRTIAIFWIF